MMKRIGALVAGIVTAGAVWAHTDVGMANGSLMSNGAPGGAMTPMSASANTVASRGFVSGSQTLYGGFSLNSAATVYILVRGPSLGTLGVTSNYLDAPRVRVFNQANQDINFDQLGNAGSVGCTGASNATAVVANYYQTRGAVQGRDTCTSGALAAGVYTFTVTPSTGVAGVFSSPSSGEVLFEVTLGP